MSNGVIYVSDSKNAKISGDDKVDATYASIKATCPDSCELKSTGCYAKVSFVGIVNARMNSRAKGKDALEVARAEAKTIDLSYNGGPVPSGRMLRLHVSGDSRTVKGSKLINSAIGRWKTRGGGKVWSYTHSWSNVHRSTWKHVSVLASIENIKDVELVRAQGYAPAIVVDHHDSDKAFKIGGSDTVFIPCPAQTQDDVACVDCKLCMKADWLYETNRGIAFAAHGVMQSNLKRHLKVIQNKEP